MWINEILHNCYFDIKKKILSENPTEFDDWLGDLNPESKVVISSALERKRDNVSKDGGGERLL